MRKRIYIGLALLFAAVCGLIAWRGLASREPSYQGSPLSAWMQDLQRVKGPISPSTRDALRHIGRDALPQIIRDLNSRDSSLQYRLCQWAFQHRFIKTAPLPASIRHHRAVLACTAIGPDAKPAIPALAALLNEPHAESIIANALGRIGGPEAVAALINSATRTNATDQVRMDVARVLGQIPSNVPQVVPLLVRCLSDSNFMVRSFAASSLGSLRQEPALAVPALVAALADSDLQVRWLTCLALGNFTNQAQSAVGPLLGMLNSPNVEVQETVAIALARIDSQNPSTVARVMPLLIQAITGRGVERAAHPRGFEFPAIEALGECGSLAKPAVPTLLDCLKDTSPPTREFVVKALQSIDPQINIPPMKQIVPSVAGEESFR